MRGDSNSSYGHYHRFMGMKIEGLKAILRGIHVLDGGLASELEYRGSNISAPLWSAQVLEDEPEKLCEVHRAFIEAGAQCIATCSYQVSRMGEGAATTGSAGIRDLPFARRSPRCRRGARRMAGFARMVSGMRRTGCFVQADGGCWRELRFRRSGFRR
jgi:S-methylmethionine-dependent homocysteine/selenocysteine methylase